MLFMLASRPMSIVCPHLHTAKMRDKGLTFLSAVNKPPSTFEQFATVVDSGRTLCYNRNTGGRVRLRRDGLT